MLPLPRFLSVSGNQRGLQRVQPNVDWFGIDGAWTFTPHQHHDDRGIFLETFRGAEFAADLGYRLDVAQVNCSVSRRGVIRGIHYADVPPGQAKYVTCVTGAILDVVVDLRAGSPTLGHWKTIRLDDQNRKAVFLAEGLGHGFMALSDQATVLYMCSTPYTPGQEHGIHPLDPELGIAWPLHEAEPLLSAKDAAAPALADALGKSLLPSYDECVSYRSELRSQRHPVQPLAPHEPGPLSRRDLGASAGR